MATVGASEAVSRPSPPGRRAAGADGAAILAVGQAQQAQAQVDERARSCPDRPAPADQLLGILERVQRLFRHLEDHGVAHAVSPGCRASVPAPRSAARGTRRADGGGRVGAAPVSRVRMPSTQARPGRRRICTSPPTTAAASTRKPSIPGPARHRRPRRRCRARPGQSTPGRAAALGVVGVGRDPALLVQHAADVAQDAERMPARRRVRWREGRSSTWRSRLAWRSPGFT